VVITDIELPLLYLQDDRKACHVGFDSMVELADEVIRLAQQIAQRYREHRPRWALAQTGLQLSSRQIAYVLGGLRLLQRQNDVPASLRDIMTDADGETIVMNDAEIDELCSYINQPETST
jgi:hypothetical protein